MGQNTVAKLGGGGTSPEVWRGGSPSYPRNKVLGNNYISKAKPAKNTTFRTQQLKYCWTR